MKQVENIYKSLPFWSWNDELDEQTLVRQIDWMHQNGIGGFFMHARGGLKTEYLGEKWFSCINACAKRAEELGMEAYAYDENGWPSGFVGGKLLEDPENHDRHLTFSVGAYDPSALVSYQITDNELIRTTLPCEHCLNVYEHLAASTVDILNPDVVDQFLEQTHEEYRKRDVHHVKGFFTDEPQYYRWGTPYTKMLAPYFEKTYGADILDGLGLLFLEKEGYRTFRYRYWKAMQTLLVENFAKRIYDWCDRHGYKLTGHYIEERSLNGQMRCCAGLMPIYEYEHIPGVDYLGKRFDNELSAKQVSSVCAQLGKKQILTETFACCGWNVSPLELKKIAELQYVGGVNLMCQHLLPYTEHGQRKRDYPAHFSDINPWIRKSFKEFNDYFSVLGKTLAESEEIVNVAMLHPMRSAYFDYKRYLDGEGEAYGIGELEDALASLVERMTAMQLEHHYLDETLLAKYGRIEGTSLVLGNCRYDYVILPKLYTMDASTERLLRAYVEAGGKLLLTDARPEYLEGERFDYDYLVSNTTWEEIRNAQPFTCSEHPTIRTAMRRDADGNRFIYAVNLGEQTSISFDLKDAVSFRSYDILTDTYQTVGTDVSFDPGQSRLLYLSDETPVKSEPLKPLTLGNRFTVCGKPQNYLTVDYARYSTDGVAYSESMHHMGIFSELLERRYEGDLYLKYEFDLRALPTVCSLITEEASPLSVEVNGVSVPCAGPSALEETFYTYPIAEFLRKGINEVILKIRYFQGENVYYALFGENVTESLKNCLAYETEIEPIYLEGDFGVYGRFEQGMDQTILLGNDFYLAEQKQSVTSLIEDGFPFFAGDITLKQTVTVEDTKRELIVNDSFQLIDVKVNGTPVGRMMFDTRLDLSRHLRVGENELELTLTVSNRNLFGPFHTPEQEKTSVSPRTFERMGTWKNGKSPLLCDYYAFVKTIV